MNSKIKIIILIFAIVIAYFGVTYYQIGNTTISKQDFAINKNETLSIIPQKLGVNINPYLYKIWIKLNYKDFKLQAGIYKIENDTTFDNLFQNILTTPVSEDLQITIIPGWNIFDIDDYLSNQGTIEKGEFIKSSQNIDNELTIKYPFLKDIKTLEGFTYPDTYRINKSSGIKEIINILLDEFSKKIYTKYKFKSDKEFYDTLILSSILEKEERNTDNKKIVAGILKKRFDEGIALGADATVCYEYKLTQKECTPAFIGEKIYIKSDYNTRQEIGLPPTPISNITDKTFDAVINFEPSPYYYYLHDNSGNIYYGKTLDEHNKNRIQYLNN